MYYNPSKQTLESVERQTRSNSKMFTKALDFLDEVKKISLRSESNMYNDFLQAMQDYKLHLIDTQGVVTRATTLFCEQPDLLRGLNLFLPEAYQIPDRTIEGGSANTNSKCSSKAKYDHAKSFVFAVKNRFEKQPEIYQGFLKLLSEFKQKSNENSTTRKGRPVGQLILEVEELFKGHQDLIDEFVVFTEESVAPIEGKKNGETERALRYRNRELREASKETEDEDDSHMASLYGPSYYYDEESNAVCSGRTEEDKAVLNYHYISQPPRMLDTSGSAGKTVLEESLFECEDGRYEMDILQERYRNLKETLQKLNKTFYELQEEKTPENIDESDLGVLNCVCIRTLYSEEGNNVLHLLTQHPRAVIPCVLNTLERKETEMKNVKTVFTEKWNKIVTETVSKIKTIPKEDPML
jgi:histone deacetylase complex regulatory component SIN3